VKYPSATASNVTMLAARVRIPPNVVCRAFAHETVVLNLETGTYHGLDPVGAKILDALERSASVGEAAAEIAATYQRPLSEIEQDVCDFCAELSKRGLISIDGNGLS
jgi:hypothetical protein